LETEVNHIGVIAIGRNEGQRLEQCLASVIGQGMPVVYVDSQSSDGSPELARSKGASVVNLDMSVPFSAARARNAGVERLCAIAPDVRYIQMLDGDCQLVAGWIERAADVLDAQKDVAVVCGRRRERFPEKSIYNRIADLEWNAPAGEVKSCGGDAMMRLDAFSQVGGFDPTVVAGEEPELCQRLRLKGWKILRIDAEMTLHDSAMLHFGQWWRRTVRSGYGAADVAARFGQQGLFVKHVQSARLWALWLPIAIVVCLAASIALVGRTQLAIGGFAIAAVLMALFPLQWLRITLGARRRTSSIGDAMIYGLLTLIGKWANLAGQWQYRRDRAAGRLARAIEYKSPGVAPVLTAGQTSALQHGN